MTRPAKIFSAVPGLIILAVLVLSLARPAFANTKPKFVYVANSGNTGNADQIENFQFSATATCSNFPCASTISITGTLTLDLSLGQVYFTTLSMTDPSDLASPPTLSRSLPLGLMPDSPTPIPMRYTAGGGAYVPSQPPSTGITIYMPFTEFPGDYSGGPICTSSISIGCAGVSSITIVNWNMSPSLLAETGGTTVTGTFVSGSLTLIPNTQNSNTISGYAINPTTGALTPIPGSPFTVGTNPNAVALDTTSKFLYVANALSSNISAFSVDPSTGALTPLPGSPFATGYTPDAIAVYPLGNFLYIANQLSDNIWAYQIDSETGTLTPISGSPFFAGHSPTSLTMDPLGRFLYVSGDDRLTPYFSFTGFTINSTTGALTPIPAGDLVWDDLGPLGAVIDPTGKFFYGINYWIPDWALSSLAVNPATGGLTSTTYGNNSDVPSAVAAHPSGKFLYETSAYGYIIGYTLDSTTGNLTYIPGSPYGNQCVYGPPCSAGSPYSTPYATGGSPQSIVIEPSGQFAYVANVSTNNVSAYSINATTGALSAVPGSPFTAGVGPMSVAVASAFFVPINFSSFQLYIAQGSTTTFTASGTFSLGQGNSGINPPSQPVTFQVGSYTATIPAGSFTQRVKNAYSFIGQINGVSVQVSILSTSANIYSITVTGKGNILSGTTNPVPVSLSIGVNEGSTTSTAVF
jgi:6-phosphogluconolactonase